MQLDGFDPTRVSACESQAGLKAAFAKLGKGNASTMSQTLHLLAVDLDEKAGRVQADHPEQGSGLLQQAVLFNSFEDHFLEDAFSAEHLIVNRSMLASVTNNCVFH